MRRDRAFTLVELLVVVGVIALLIALLMPALRGARQAAMQLECAANMRQWTTALHVYVDENNGSLPRRGQGGQPTSKLDRPTDWFNALPPIMRMKSYQQLASDAQIPHSGDRSIWVCPAAVSDGPGPYYFSYSMNMGLSTWSTTTPDKITSVASWSTFVFMGEGPGAYCAVWPVEADFSPVARHRGKMNVSFLDGHVAAMRAGEVMFLADGAQRPDVRWVVPASPWTGPGSN